MTVEPKLGPEQTRRKPVSCSSRMVFHELRPQTSDPLEEVLLLYQACGLAVLPRKKSHPWLEWLFKFWKVSGFLCVCVPAFYPTIQHSGLTAIPDPHYSCAHTPSPPHLFFLGAGHGFTAKFAAAKGLKLHSFQNFPVWARCIA